MNHACETDANVNNAIRRIMPNTGGPGQSRRILLFEVAMPVAVWSNPQKVHHSRNVNASSTELVVGTDSHP